MTPSKLLEKQKKHIAILGSTGSIGTQALEVIRANAEYFQVEVLVSNNNVDLLVAQSLEFQPNVVVIANEQHYESVSSQLSPAGIKVYTGAKAIADVVQMDTIDVVLAGMVGYAGVLPVIKAIEAGKPIALANKETLVVAGELITNLAREKGVNIYPVDSEHSAIFQCLCGEFSNPIEKIILTASGGPFRGWAKEALAIVTKTQALKHPNWSMGPKITIDSATLMNKGLEVIEAKWLFGLKPEQIEVIVHPQSIIHSIVQFQDGSMKAQMGLPDMRLPIQYALTYPDRLKTDFQRFNFIDYPALTFEKPVVENFKNLALAYYALNKGGNMPCILNAANEIAVNEFLTDKIGFLEMPDLIEKCLHQISFVQQPSFEDLVETDRETRIMALELITNRKNYEI